MENYSHCVQCIQCGQKTNRFYFVNINKTKMLNAGARCTAPVSDHVYAHQFYMLGSLLAICDVRIFTYYTILVSQCSLAPANVMCNTNYFMALSKKKTQRKPFRFLSGLTKDEK